MWSLEPGYLPSVCMRGGSECKELTYHFDEFGVLHHHGMNDSQEALIRWEDTRASGQRVTLDKTLAHMFAQDFDDPATFRARELIPLEISPSVIQSGAQFVALQFIR